ncbi:MAG: hypothetical protein QXF56_04885 [Candidatus Micrarchaeia archaeon]
MEKYYASCRKPCVGHLCKECYLEHSTYTLSHYYNRRRKTGRG